MSLGGLLWMVFVIWMIVDCLREKNQFFWIWLILLFQPFGALVYFVVHKLPNLELGRRLDAVWSGRRRIQALKAKIHDMDRPLHWAKLGDEYATARNWLQAARCYEESLARDPDTEEARYGLGRAHLALGRFDEALDELLPLVETAPRYAYGEGQWAVARAWRGLGRADEAIGAYEALLKNYTYSQAHYEYAELLHEQDRGDEATRHMQRIVEDGQNATGFNKGRERRWGRKAARFLRLHGQPARVGVSR
jgi:hypothetical protein